MTNSLSSIKTRLAAYIAAILIILSTPLTHADDTVLAKFHVDVSSAKLYMNMAQKAVGGDMPSDADWNALFGSTAYKTLLDNIHWDKDEFKHNVREAFEIVYDETRKDECDSIAGMLGDLTSLQDELPFFVSTALTIRNKLDEYAMVLSTIDMDSVITAANALALGLLPNNGKGLEPDSSPIYFIVWDLECRALNPGLFLDVNSFFYNGIESAIEVLGHEMHHFYLGTLFDSIYEKDIMDGAVLALASNMKEGVADIINKKQMPATELPPYGDSMLKMYNDDYFASPTVLAELDSVTCRYLDNELTFEEYFQKAMECAHFEGHTTGDYMVFLIRDQLGIDAVVESVGDIDAFVDNYNKAAEKVGSYRFSDRFTQHIHALSQDAKRKH